MARNEIENPCRTDSTGIRRPKATVSGTPRASEVMNRNSTNSVVTLMPPPVEAGPAPTNISIICVSQVSSCICE